MRLSGLAPLGTKSIFRNQWLQKLQHLLFKENLTSTDQIIDSISLEIVLIVLVRN